MPASFEQKVYTLKDVSSYTYAQHDFERPQEIACYSVDENKNYWFDDRERRYYSPSPTRDLTGGYEQAVLSDIRESRHLDPLLDTLTDLNIKTGEKHTADIVTWRGIIAKMLCAPYKRKPWYFKATRNTVDGPWHFRATRYNGMIFIQEQATDEKIEYELGRPDEDMRTSFYGHKFEALCTTNRPPNDIENLEEELQNRLTRVVNTNLEYCTVVKTRLGKTSIIMGAKIDCCHDEMPEDPFEKCGNYIKLKTEKVIETKNQYSFYRYKLLKVWSQSVPISVPTIYCGFRDDNGQISDIQEFQTKLIPTMVQEEQKKWEREKHQRKVWNDSVCLNAANEILDWIVSNITKDDPAITYSIKFEKPFKKIILECEGHSNVFLTQRFIDGTTQNQAGGPRVQVPDTMS